MASLDNLPDNMSEYFTAIRRGATDLLVGTDKVDVGRSMIVSNLLMAAKTDEDFRITLAARSLALVTKRNDENKSEVDAAKRYFADLFLSENSDLSGRVTQKDEADKLSRDRHNNKVSALEQAAMFAAFVIIAIDHCKVWQSLSAPKNKANKGNIMMSFDGANIVWPDRTKTLDTMSDASTHIMISNRAGAWRYSSLETMGKAVAEMKGLRKTTAARATPIADAAQAMRNSVEANDAKALKPPKTRLEVFEMFIATLDYLNSSDVEDHLDSVIVRPFREHVIEKMADVQKALTASQLKHAGADAQDAVKADLERKRKERDEQNKAA